MSNPDAARRVVEHLPWLAPFLDVCLGLGDQTSLARDLHDIRLRLGRDMIVGGEGSLLAATPLQTTYVPHGMSLVAGTVLRFVAISTGYEDPCSWSGPSAPIFVVEDGPWKDHSTGIYLEWLDEEAVMAALAIEEDTRLLAPVTYKP